MKLLTSRRPWAWRSVRRRSALAYTLPEMMISVSIFILMTLGVLYAMIFGMKWDELVLTKLGASEKSRMSFDQLVGEIRGCKKWRIGNGSDTNFNELPNQTALSGNAVQIYNDANNPTNYIRYWFNTNHGWLCRITNGTPGYTILAHSLTNASGVGMTFQAQDFNGSNLMDLTYKYVIVTTMEFCQYQYPLTRVGPGYYYDYYRIQLKVASHAPN